MEQRAKRILHEQESESYQQMALDAEKDFRKLEIITNECFNSMLDNKIYIIGYTGTFFL